MVDSGDLRRLAPAGREVVRLRVVAALESGAVGSYRQAAEVFQVSERSVGSWWRAYQAGGREALAVKRTLRLGPHELIGGEERAVLFQAMADYKCYFPRSQQDPQQVLSLQVKSTFRVSDQPLDRPPRESAG